MSVWNYNDTPLPVGFPVNANGSDAWYHLGFYDGATYAEQYADEPDEGVLFESPEAAATWLATVTEVLQPYIDSADRSVRIPNPDGWAVA